MLPEPGFHCAKSRAQAFTTRPWILVTTQPFVAFTLVRKYRPVSMCGPIPMSRNADIETKSGC